MVVSYVAIFAIVVEARVEKSMGEAISHTLVEAISYVHLAYVPFKSFGNLQR